MTPESKQKAFKKIDNVAVNIAYPEVVSNNSLLIQYYEPFKFDENDDIIIIMQQLANFNTYKQLNYLSYTSLDRHEFNSQIVMVIFIKKPIRYVNVLFIG